MSEITREVTPEELEAIKALEARGITPTPQLVSEWIAQRRREHQGTQPEAMPEGKPGSKPRAIWSRSFLIPYRRRGRPAYDAAWIRACAALVAHGWTVRGALEALGFGPEQAELEWKRVSQLNLFRDSLAKYGLNNLRNRPRKRNRDGTFARSDLFPAQDSEA